MPSTTVALSANTENHSAAWSAFYNEIIVTNGSSSPVFVRTDGAAAAATGSGSEEVPAGQVGAFGNEQPEPDITGAPHGSWTNGSGTYVSLYTTGTGVTVVVSVQ